MNSTVPSFNDLISDVEVTSWEGIVLADVGIAGTRGWLSVVVALGSGGATFTISFVGVVVSSFDCSISDELVTTGGRIVLVAWAGER